MLDYCRYDIAVSTACGPLDYIVVEDTATAQACVALLRERNLGVATFLMLDQQAKFVKNVQEKPSTPESVPRLFDLVKVCFVDATLIPNTPMAHVPIHVCQPHSYHNISLACIQACLCGAPSMMAWRTPSALPSAAPTHAPATESGWHRWRR
jgi:hypothetical protein